MSKLQGAHVPQNTALWRDPLQPSPGTVPVPAGSSVIREGRRVRLERTGHAWLFTIPSSRAALGVPDHSLTVALDGSWALCSCGSCVNRDRCTLVDNPTAILRHHGLLPPADPGGAGRVFAPCHRCPAPRTCARDGCRLLRAADPGGAALDRAQAEADDEADAWEAELRKVRHDEGLRALYG